MGIVVNLDKFAHSTTLVVGDLMLDRYLWGDVQRISPEAPVPVCHVRRLSETPGGAGNVVSNLKGLGSAVILVGVRGNDVSGERLIQLLQTEKVEVHILCDERRPTVTKTRVVSNGQQLLRLDEEEITPISADIQNGILDQVMVNLPKCNAVIMSDYGKGVLKDTKLCQRIIKLANDSNIPVFIDPKGKEWERYNGATCVTPNSKELEIVSGDMVTDTEQLIHAMRYVRAKYNLSWIVVTRGPLGMCLMNRSQEPIFLPTVAREVYDVSGAGDTVIATLALTVASGQAFVDSAKVANLAAGIVVGKTGTQPISMSELKLALQTAGVDGTTSYAAKKIASRASAAIQVDAWKAKGEKIVFTNGWFEFLHPGYIHLLHQAKDLGDRLVIGLNADSSVRRIKGPGRPALSENDRASLLGSLQCVDMVVIVNEESQKDLIGVLRPDVIVKTAECPIEKDAADASIASYGGEIKLIPLLEGYSTTEMRNRMLEAVGSDVVVP